MNQPRVGNLRKFVIVSLIFAVMGTIPLASIYGAGAEGEKVQAFRNPSLSIQQRVDDLISQMTLEEKVRQMQNGAPAIPRLGIPAYDWWSEGLHGVARSGHATVFPQAIGMAATWNTDLIFREGRVISTEARAKFNQAQRDNIHSTYFGLTFWSPNINIFRDPRWGRGQETYGEDPFLTGKLGVAYVKGVQGDDSKYLQAVATPKHYAVHSGPESKRHGFNVKISPHDLEDTYLPAFRATVVDGKADSVMCAYNAVDGFPACANPFLIQKTLREAWGFQGYVTSDCFAVTDFTAGHHFTPDVTHASVAAVRAGTDLACGEEYVSLAKAVENGMIKESELDTSLRRLLTARIRLGLFDPPDTVAFNQIPYSQNDSTEHRTLALQAARESMVLLKNSGDILPLKPKVKSIAVIGPNAEALLSLEGNYNGAPSKPVLPKEGIEKVFADKAKVLYAQGSPFVMELPLPIPSTALRPGAGAKVAGLRGEYFPNPDFKGKPTLVRVDPQVQFDWSSTAPAEGIPMRAFAVRWTGQWMPPGPGDYSFGIEQPFCWPCEDAETFRLYLDDKLVIDTTQKNRNPAVPAFQTHFANSKPHQIRLEYTHQSDLYAAGVTLVWKPPAQLLREEAVRLAKKADVIVALIGLSPGLEGEEMGVHIEGFLGGDRSSIGLPRIQQELLEALKATGKPLIAVLMNGSALAVNWAAEHAAAVLEAWYPGQEGGTAIAETLAGINNPGGRLPVTFYASTDQLPAFEDYSMKNRTYRYFQGKPLYGFGYGLSYSKFEYRNLKLATSTVKAGDSLKVEVEVRNSSKLAGDEVVQLYLSKKEGAPAGLVRALRGFERVHLAAGEAKKVAFLLAPRDLSFVTEQGEHAVLSGQYQMFVGG
ncbi:MAG: glycoside hydrolase family 3 C-terminal domain-containing protein, partial [Terriglobia bacterium]